MAVLDKNYDVLFRIMILGDTGVGKTSLLQRFCEQEFRHSHVCTIGIDFQMKTITVDDLKVRVQIWDTAGQERYRTITRQYYRKAQGVVLVYDITDEKSFVNIRKWINDIGEFGDKRVRTMLVGNKSDREDSRAVNYEHGKNLADEYGMKFCECSAYTDSNVISMFTEITKEVVEVHKDDIKSVDYCTFSSEEDSSEEDEGIVQDIGGGKGGTSETEKSSPFSCCVIL